MEETFVANLALADFMKARHMESVSRILNLFRRGKTELLSFDEIRNIIKPKNERYLGRRTVPISSIIGSEGRYRDFNRMFLPKHNYSRGRWINIDKAHLSNLMLPPVTLYEIGGMYFIRDGNHRVSVAKMNGVREIDADVVSLASSVTLKPDMTADEIRETVVRHEGDVFYAAAGFLELLPRDKLLVTAPGGYDALIADIESYRKGREEILAQPVAFPHAAYRWYFELYLPVIDLLRKEKLLFLFPKRTETDLYSWVLTRRDALTKLKGTTVPLEETLKHVRTVRKPRVLQTLFGFFRGNTGKYR